MSNYNAIKTATNAYIKTNGRQEITGNILNAVMIATIGSLGRFYQFAGVATPDIDPGRPDENVAYIAGTPGTYQGFEDSILAAGEIAVLKWDGHWLKQVVCSLPSKVSDLTNDLGFITNAVSDLVNYYTKNETYTRSEVASILSSYYDKDEVDSIINSITGQSYVLAWDGTSTPVPSHIPSGVSVFYGGNTYNGTLSPSANTLGKVYLVSNGVGYDMYVTSHDSVYSWIGIGTSNLDLSGYATQADLDDVEVKVDLMYPNVIEDTSVDPTEQTLLPYQINIDNEYTTNSDYKHITIPVSPGQKVRVKASGNTCQMAWFRNNNAPVSGGTPPFVAGTSRFTLSANTEDVYTVPDGAVSMYFYAGASPYSYLPASINVTSSKVPGLVNSLSSDSTIDALSANNGKTLEKGYKEEEQTVTKTTKLMISDTGYITTNSGTTYVVYSVAVTKGDILHITASDSSSHTIRCGFATTVAANYYAWNYTDLSSSTVDATFTAPFDGYYIVFHISTYFTNMSITKRAYTTDGAVGMGTETLLDGLATMLGVKDYEKVIPFWLMGKFQYYNQNGDASASSMARTGKIPVNGRKWIYFTQYVTTGNGTAGIRFFDENDGGIIGFRQVIDADAIGLRRVLLEIPANSSYFIASCSQSRMNGWFAYLFDDDHLANLIRTADDRKHIKVCLLGNSYTADAWRYVPKMLLAYGITMESFFYYRGQGSLYDLDTQWDHTSATDISDYDHQQHARITFYVNSENDPVWREWGSVLSAEDIVGRRKWDIISLQQGGNRCKDIDSYYPSLQNIIDKIALICDYPYSLWWYMAYNGSGQNAEEGMNQQSLDTQKYIIKVFPFDNFFPTAAAVFDAQQNATLADLGSSSYKHMYASDNVHMQEGIPCYVAACSVVQRLLDVFRPGMSVLQDQFRATAENIADLGMPQTANGSSTGVNEGNCYLAQKAAIVADKSPYEIIPV